MSIKIALVGNPNSGKTTLFNALTGMNQYVGNWPGVTVEKKEGRIKSNKDVILTDLPGIYSLSPYTPEEIIARNYLTHENPDVIINVIDGTNLERNLYLTTQLLELGTPLVVAVNMMDIVRKKGDTIDIDSLSKKLGCPMIEVSALKNRGIHEVADKAISLSTARWESKTGMYQPDLENALVKIEELALSSCDLPSKRWYAVKLFERDETVRQELKLDSVTIEGIDEIIKSLETAHNDNCESIITNDRYNYITDITKNSYTRSTKVSITEKIDRIVTHRIWAFPIFILVMFCVYALSIGTIGDWTVGFMNDTLFGEWIIPSVTSGLESIGMQSWLVSLIADGIVGGVGAVLGFVPQMIILFLLLSLLEDCGYMSRVAFIMDRLFRKLGLSGKSFIPMLVASGCGVPGIMASRTIDQERDRRMTIMTTGFIPCGAKMPIVGLIAGALFGDSAIIATSAYFIGIGAVVISGIILKKTKPFRGEPAPFVMELPQYHAPVPGNILRTTWERGWSFIVRAGTVILASSVIIWVLNSLSFTDGFHFITEENGGASILENIGSAISWLFVPLGFGSWQAAVATILGLVAKEEVVGTFGTLSSMANADLAMEGDVTMYATIAKEFFGDSSLAGFSFMIFNLLCAPCFAAMGAIKREMNNWKWTAFALIYMTAFAYAISFIVYQIGTLFIGGASVIGVILAFMVLGIILYLVFRRDGFSIIDLIRGKRASNELK
ncbi:MAG: ferrous iron transport protein B [Clostridia bacterium]|nr:ferrous iron transport protein B [Clostridia bacterium]